MQLSKKGERRGWDGNGLARKIPIYMLILPPPYFHPFQEAQTPFSFRYRTLWVMVTSSGCTELLSISLDSHSCQMLFFVFR